MKIYTKTGDKGSTSLAVGGRIRKSDRRLEAYGTADELNSFVGWLRACVSKTIMVDDACENAWQADVDVQLNWIQNRLFEVGAILAGADMSVSESSVNQLEIWMDTMQSELPELRSFILPGGCESVSVCHVCRTVTRRLERSVVDWCDSEGRELPSDVVCWVNRLSDYFFVMSRFLSKNLEISCILWEK
jgi:cob(I)alamin adenosyltransferase